MEQLFPWPELTHITSRGQANPKQELSPRKTLRMGWLEGAQGHLKPSVSAQPPAGTAEQRDLWSHSTAWDGLLHELVALTAPAPGEEAQAMGGLNSGRVYKEHGW